MGSRTRDLGLLALFALGVLALSAALGLRARDAPATHAPETDDAASDGGAGDAPFIAFARDFRGFRGWERHLVEGAMMPVGAPDGPSYVYLNRRAPAGARRWPIGTIVVKTIEPAGREDAWTIHAMVKRGVPYNDDGAIGWEYFELRLAPGAAEPVVVWRGPGPPSGHGYAARGRDAGASEIPLVCNDCHAAGWRSDAILTPALALR